MSGYEQKTIHAASKDGSIEGAFTNYGGAFNLTGLALTKPRYNVVKTHKSNTDALREYLDSICAEIQQRPKKMAAQSDVAKSKQSVSEELADAPAEFNISSNDGHLEGTFTYRYRAFNLTGLTLARHYSRFTVCNTDALVKHLDAISAAVQRRPEKATEQSDATNPTEAASEKQIETSVEKPVNKSQLAYTFMKNVFDDIHQKIGRHKPELGGMLGGSRQDRTITHFYFDSKANTSSVTYSPDAKTLNDVVKEWNNAGIDLIGMVHSHPGNFTRPSGGDEVYANAFLQVCEDMDAFFMPIIRSEVNGGFEMKGYIFSRHPTGNRLAPIDYRVY